MRATISVAEGGALVTVHLTGDLTVWHVRQVHEQLQHLARRPEIRRVRLDFSGVGRLDSAGAVVVAVGGERMGEAGKQWELRELAARHRKALEILPRRVTRPRPAAPLAGPFERLGQFLGRGAKACVELAGLVAEVVWSLARCSIGRERFRFGRVVEHAVAFGVGAVVVVTLFSLLIGIILGFQSAFQLRQFGAEIYMAEIVALGMVREFGPIMAAIILAGRSGAAMAAELGTMSVHDEIDALRTMGIGPVPFLVLPRVVAMTFVQPMLSMMATGVGIAGGLATAGVVGVPVRAIYYRMQEALMLGDFWLGFSKSVLFAWIIAFIACSIGLRTSGGAHSVGQGTTRAVVASIFLIVATDSLVTTLWTLGHD